MSTQRFPCPFPACKKTYTAPHNVRRHYSDIHEGVRYTCDICGDDHSTKQNLERHKSKHQDKTTYPFKCPECGQRTITKQNLDSHMNMHTGNRPFICDFEDCGMSFTQHSHLAGHKLLHTGEKPFACPECGKRVRQSAHLKTHRLQHTGERPYKCDLCSHPGYTTPDGLLMHTRQQHSTERPYRCSESGCTLAFASSGLLVRHVRTHFPENLSYACPQCDQTYMHPQSLTAHIASFHTLEGQQRKKRKEAKILDLLKKNDIPFKPQHSIDFRCLGGKRDGQRCFIDFLVEIRDENDHLVGIVFLEVDETQHDGYPIACDLRRMADVYESLTMEGNTLPIAFIRYNPDDFFVRGIKRTVPQATRKAKLIKLLKEWKFSQPFSVLYMYYDIFEAPVIFEDEEYNEAFKDACVGYIVD